MILQLVLSLALGFGVLSLASIALLNAAGHKLHDIREKSNQRPNGRPILGFVYDSDKATKLRKWFARMPEGIGWGAIVAIVFVGSIAYAGIDPPVPPKSGDPDTVHLQPYGVLLWASVSAYVGILVFVISCMSRGLYKVLQSIHQR